MFRVIINKIKNILILKRIIICSELYQNIMDTKK